MLADRQHVLLDADAQQEWERINSRPARSLPGLTRLLGISPSREPLQPAGAAGGPSPTRRLPLPLQGADDLARGVCQASPWNWHHPRVFGYRDRSISRRGLLRLVHGERGNH